MKLVSLNTWGATQGEVFSNYIKEQAKSADIFCFQEIFSARLPAPEVSSGARMFLFEELSQILTEFTGLFCERSRGYDFMGPVEFPVSHGLAVFVRKSISITENSSVDLGQSDEPVEGAVKIQVLNLSAEEKQFCLLNYHGPALPGDKQDTQERIAISEKLRAIWKSLSSPAKILTGDFNLYPETESIKILEDCGKNLIKDFGIKNTRNEISWEKFHNEQHFADYAFVSPEIKVKNFEVPYNLVSDHLPMLLDFSID